MNMSTTKRYQDILQELSKTPREDVVKFRNKYEEALNEFLELKEVYKDCACRPYIYQHK